ncbi:hypothetical protein [Hoylesella nanceiensis]|uniref:hypothetical protein n=1 Tax=Hoylesella nanceiensis TaxID=425941 RepID=UPI0028E3D40C|nr:hypothetical protein [Hoylesella nanceiensis]
MKKYIFSATLLLATIISFMSSCQRISNSNDMTIIADSFATNFYNWRLEKAFKYCTAESKTQISYLASNISEEDVELINKRNEDASIEITNTEMLEGSLKARVSMKIYNSFKMKDINSDIQFNKERDVTINLIKTNEGWKVDLTTLKETPVKE